MRTPVMWMEKEKKDEMENGEMDEGNLTDIKPMMLCTLSLGGDQDKGSHGSDDVDRWGSLHSARGPGTPMSRQIR